MRNLFLTLYFDDRTEAAVQALRERIDAAGLPTKGIHNGHRPHVTLAAYPHGDDDQLGWYQEQAAAFAAERGPLPITLHHVGVFPKPGAVFLAVLVTAELLALHADLHRYLTDAGAPETTFAGQLGPGRWAPHSTLSSGVPPAQIGRIVDVASQRWREIEGSAAGIGVLAPTGREPQGQPIPDRSRHPFGAG